jgi:hypothetical protein
MSWSSKAGLGPAWSSPRQNDPSSTSPAPALRAKPARAPPSERYRAGRATDYAAETPESIGVAIAEALDATVDSADVERDGARRAARLIAELL